MKHLNQFITEYIVKKKLDKPIDSEDNYEYFPKTKEELIENIKELISKDIYDFNCIDTSEITDMSDLFNDIQVRKNFNVSKWNDIYDIVLYYGPNLTVSITTNNKVRVACSDGCYMGFITYFDTTDRERILQ